MANKKRLILIDSFALIHRSFHALPLMTSPKGEITNAVYGFTSTLLKVIKDLKPDYLAAAYDLPEMTERQKIYKEYKAQRAAAPAELIDQIPLVTAVLEAFNIPIYSQAGYEADDVIGSLARKACQTKDLGRGAKENLEVIIVTGDNDTLQLVNDCVKVYTMKRGLMDTVLYDKEEVKRKYGFGPERLVDYKALRGDPSDNIPGVPGIGEKTARELILKFGSLENIYKFAKSGQLDQFSERLRILLLEHEKEAFLSKKLSTIVCDLPVKLDWEEMAVHKYDVQKVYDLFRELGFKSLLARLPIKGSGLKTQDKSEQLAMGNEQGQTGLFEEKKVESEKIEIKQPENTTYKLIETKDELVWLAKQLKKSNGFVFDTETSGLRTSAELIGISFSWKEGEAYYVPVYRSPAAHIETGFSQGEVKKILGPVFENENIPKWGQNLKFDIGVMHNAGFQVQGANFDTMIASYLLNPGTRSHGLDYLAFVEFGHNMIPISALIGSGKNQISLADVPIKDVAIYSCEDADFTLRLKNVFEKKLSPELKKILREIEVPLIAVLLAMEAKGILIDKQFLAKISKLLKSELLSLQKKIYEISGAEFNINSPQQIQEILFVRLGLMQKGIRRIKTGTSTAAEELEKLSGLHPVIDLILRYRELFKLLNTYIDVLPKLADKSGRVHTSFNQTVTATGRLSSSNPNLQNIPVRTAEGKQIRKAFIAEKGKVLLSADYSQIELRIIAHISNDPKMKQAFLEGEDIHAATAAAVFETNVEKITPEQRRLAKTVNFGLLYGMGVSSVAQAVGMSKEKAQQFVDRYFERFTGIKKYVDNTLDKARREGYVETLFGRRRYIPEINAGHAGLRSAAERMAINMPVQGTAADILKKAMVEIARQKLHADLLLTVHDELVFEVERKNVAKAAKKIKEIMEGVVKLSVPLVVEIKTGQNWGEMEAIAKF